MTRSQKLAAVLVCLPWLVGPASLLDPAAAQEKKPESTVWCIGSFEPGAKDCAHVARHAAVAVESGGPEGEHHLCWQMKASRLPTRLRFQLRADLSGFSVLSFHARADKALAAGALQISLRSAFGRYAAPLPEVGTEWKRFEIPLIAFSEQLLPDRRKISSLEFLERKIEKPAVLRLDHVCLHRHPNGWRGGVPRRLDFEQRHHLSTAYVVGGRVKAVPDKTSGTVLAWTLRKRRVGYVDLPLVPLDIRGEASFAFRIRADREVPAGRLVLRVYDRNNNYLRFALKEIGTEWTRAQVPLAYFTRSGAFDPKAVEYVEWIVWKATPCTFYLDDLTWIAGDAGASSWRQGRRAKVDFNAPGCIHGLEADHSSIRLVSGRRKRAVAEWSVPAKQKWVALELSCLPEDVRAHGALKLRIRPSRAVGPDEIYLRFCTTADEYLDFRLPALKKGKWAKLTLPLADFEVTRWVDPSAIRTLEVLGWDLAPIKLAFAEIELTRGKRGNDSWRPSDKHLMARFFGAKRVSKVKRVKTKYFEVWTDSKAALGSFVRTLDKHVVFVCRKLGMPRPTARIPVYLFRNAEGYRDFCVRCAGYTEEEASTTAGHGCSRYFAAYFTRPNSPVVVHELTHTLVCRTHGSWGGSWLHEGFAVYVESAFESKDPVKEFSVHLRNERHEPLAKFLTEGSLAASGSRKESNRVGRLYDQAGAFFAFLKDGPHRDKYPELVKRLMKAPGEARDRGKVIEKLYGRSLAELEKEWVAWGTKRR